MTRDLTEAVSVTFFYTARDVVFGSMPTIYDRVYRQSLDNPVSFWAAAAEAIHWDRRWSTVRDDTKHPFHRWFAGGELNTCYNALDRHIDCGRGKQLALIYDSPVTDTIRRFTFTELRDEGYFTFVVSDAAGESFSGFASGFERLDTPSTTVHALARGEPGIAE